MKIILLSIIILLSAGCADANTDITYNVPEAITATVNSPNLEQIIADGDESADIELSEDEPEEKKALDYEQLKEMILEQFETTLPSVWGENIEGVVTEIDTDDKVVALTFDACDGSADAYDEKLINFLIEEHIPATLFINAQWIEENREILTGLASNPLFEIANHGYHHKPLSVTGESAYGIIGTENAEAAFDEIYKNQQLIEEVTNETPKYFRSGTAYYDDVAVEIIEELGLKAVNYNVLGDAGGTFSQNQIVSAFESAQEGSIFLFYMNKPHSDISSGVKEGVQMLLEEGYEFVQLGEYDGHF